MFILTLSLILSILGLVAALFAAYSKQTIIQRKIVVEDDIIKVNDGIIQAKGFTSRSIVAESFTDGRSLMTQGNLTIEKSVQCQNLTDGVTVIENGDITTPGHVAANKLTVNHSLSAPAEFYGTMVMLEMSPIHFTTTREWVPLGDTTKETQLFFPAIKDLHNGLSIRKNNHIQFGKEGKWHYQFNVVLNTSSSSASFGVSLGHSASPPKLSHGFGSTHISGAGILIVTDTDDMYQLWAQHTAEIEDYTTSLTEGTLTCMYLGR